MPRLAGRIAAERPDVASALAALEGPVRHYADYAGLVVRRAPERGERLPLEESEGEAFRSVRRADARATELINAKTNAQIGLWTSREIYVRTLVAGAIAVLIGLVVAFLASSRWPSATRRPWRSSFSTSMASRQ